MTMKKMISKDHSMTKTHDTPFVEELHLYRLVINATVRHAAEGKNSLDVDEAVRSDGIYDDRVGPRFTVAIPISASTRTTSTSSTHSDALLLATSTLSTQGS